MISVWTSSDDVSHHSAGHIGEAEITSGIAVRESLVIQAQQVQDRRVQVVHVHSTLNRLVTDFVGLAVAEARLDSTACQENREAAGIVIPAVVALIEGRPAELATPPHQCVIQQTALL